jgi:hypothetical protein
VERLVDALLDRGDVVVRHDAALDLVEELEALARVRLEPQVDLGELAATAGLLLVAVLALGPLLDGLRYGSAGGTARPRRGSAT